MNGFSQIFMEEIGFEKRSIMEYETRSLQVIGMKRKEFTASLRFTLANSVKNGTKLKLK